MFNGLFNNEQGCEQGCGCGNCTWILLIILFLCCGGKMKNFSLTVNPTCLILMVALLLCCGGLTVGKDCR